MSGNSRDRRLVRRSHQRAGARVPNTYRRLADKVMVLGVFTAAATGIELSVTSDKNRITNWLINFLIFPTLLVTKLTPKKTTKHCVTNFKLKSTKMSFRP